MPFLITRLSGDDLSDPLLPYMVKNKRTFLISEDFQELASWAQLAPHREEQLPPHATPRPVETASVVECRASAGTAESRPSSGTEKTTVIPLIDLYENEVCKDVPRLDEVGDIPQPSDDGVFGGLDGEYLLTAGEESENSTLNEDIKDVDQEWKMPLKPLLRQPSVDLTGADDDENNVKPLALNRKKRAVAPPKGTYAPLTKKKLEYACHVVGCGAVLFSQSQVVAHMAQQHPGVKPFACQYCPGTYTTNYQRRQHEFKHASESRIDCRICGNSCLNLTKLFDHMVTAHAAGGPPFECPDCGKAFAQVSDLRQHVARQGGQPHIRCYICNLSLSPEAFPKHQQEEHPNQ